MSKDFLGDRKRALEDSFFAKEDARLREKIRQENAHKEKREQLSAAVGAGDQGLLDELIKLNIGAEELTALSLIPLVEVAWADGKLDDNERKAIMKASEKAGINQDSAASGLLKSWLTHAPGSDLMTAWKGYIGALKSEMSAACLAQLKKDVLGRANDVAKSSGGFLGLGSKTNSDEQKVLDELERAFQ